MKVICYIIVLSGFLGGCALINKKLGFKDDNVFEEIVENHFEDQTGLDIDFTPFSDEY